VHSGAGDLAHLCGALLELRSAAMDDNVGLPEFVTDLKAEFAIPAEQIAQIATDQFWVAIHRADKLQPFPVQNKPRGGLSNRAQSVLNDPNRFVHVAFSHRFLYRQRAGASTKKPATTGFSESLRC
jgi:hypothetical protein